MIQFEKTVVVEKNTKFIDGYIPATKVLIEQKGAHVKLGKTAVQSDGEKLTPYGQAFRYNNYLPYEERARWIIVSNFERILICILPSILTPNDSGGMENFKTERQKRGELGRKTSG